MKTAQLWLPRCLFYAALLAVLLALPLLAQAQTGGGYDLTWSTIDGGGGTLSGGVYTLDGSIGQPDAGTLSGGSYTLAGGYWSGNATTYRVFLSLVLK